jgi:hypothetical protein
MKNEILIIGATHGNEPIGVEVIAELKNRGREKDFDFLIANPQALSASREFIDVNLNRVYPGIKNSPLYEQRLAFTNLQLAKKYRYVVDIHEASQGKDDFIIVPRENISNDFPLELVNLKKILLWPDPQGPLGGVLKNAIELEFGSCNRDRRKMIAMAANIVEKFIIRIKSCAKEELVGHEIYEVYGKITIAEFGGKIDELKDFAEFENNGEKFLPLLARQYLQSGIVCYKMRRCYDCEKF